MKIYNEKHTDITLNIKDTLGYIRQMRNFNEEMYIESKVEILNSYMKKSGLDCCVVALSGGIDSAVVLSLVNMAMKKRDSVIKKVIAVTIPSFDGSVTNQHDTVLKSKELCINLGLSLCVLDITSNVDDLARNIEKTLGFFDLDLWSRGQLVSYLRTPSLYYYTTVLNATGLKPILVGTINRDEGSYLGYLCKSGDSCVDVQLISDLHKSEVYKIAKILKVPKIIIDSIPTGDMYDSRVDEEVFGAPYDFVELFLNYKNITENMWNALTEKWCENDWIHFNKYCDSLENLHNYNAHKYLAGSIGIHLDVLESAVKGGWIEGVHTSIHKAVPYINMRVINTKSFVGFIDNAPKLENHKSSDYELTADNKVLIVKNVVSTSENKNIRNWINENTDKMVITNEYGYVKTNENTCNGSKRISFYNQDWSNILFERLKLSGGLNGIYNINYENNDTNWNPHSQWRLVGLSPLFRVIKYEEGDFLYSHYDDSFYESDIRRSLKSVVIVIECADSGGKTRFLIDEQDKIEFIQRDFSDKHEIAEESAVNYAFNELSSAMVFNHRILHDGETVINGSKIIIRTDLMYEKCCF